MVMNSVVLVIMVALVGNLVYHQLANEMPNKILGGVTAVATGVFLCTLLLPHLK